MKTPPGPTGKWATFFLAGEMFGLAVEDVQEVLMDQPLWPVPLAPDHIAGLLHLRGEILPAIDLRRRLLFPPRPLSGPGSARKLLVLAGSALSLVVDEIADVLELPTAGWEPPPDTLSPEQRSFLSGICPIEGRVVLGLRPEALTSELGEVQNG